MSKKVELYKSLDNQVLGVLYRKSQKKFTLKKIYRELDKRLTKLTFEITEIKRILDDLLQQKYINSFGVGAKTKYQITNDGIKKYRQIMNEYFERTAHEAYMKRIRAEYEAKEKGVPYIKPIEERNSITTDEYKKLTKWDKKLWTRHDYDGRDRPTGYRRKTEADRRKNRGTWFACIFCTVVLFVFGLVLILVVG